MCHTISLAFNASGSRDQVPVFGALHIVATQWRALQGQPPHVCMPGEACAVFEDVAPQPWTLNPNSEVLSCNSPNALQCEVCDVQK